MATFWETFAIILAAFKFSVWSNWGAHNHCFLGKSFITFCRIYVGQILQYQLTPRPENCLCFDRGDDVEMAFEYLRDQSKYFFKFLFKGGGDLSIVVVVVTHRDAANKRKSKQRSKVDFSE